MAAMVRRVVEGIMAIEAQRQAVFLYAQATRRAGNKVGVGLAVGTAAEYAAAAVAVVDRHSYLCGEFTGFGLTVLCHGVPPLGVI